MNKNINFKDLKTGENIDKIIKKRKYLPSLTLFINILLKKGLKLKNFLLFFKLLILIKLRLLEIRKIKRKKREKQGMSETEEREITEENE